MPLWIKICANTSLEDALLAAEAGADAVGFVFAPSPRRVTLTRAAAIVPHLPPAVEKIGVFVDATYDEIASTVEACSLTGVQLHFDAPPDLPARLRRHFGPSLRILGIVHFNAQPAKEEIDSLPGHDSNPASKGFVSGHDSNTVSKGFVSGHDFSRAENAPKREGALAPAACFSEPDIDAILVDSRTAAAAGGTGVAYDWSSASKSLFRNPAIQKPLVVAGGLSPANVAEAIAILHPWGVDVVSGVESAPGKKDHDKVRAFIANARAAAK